ncbi:MAG TPA: redoxin domain-containing protein [Gemmatimonadaceae bacterium]|jgi:Peroxiredoxin
MEAYRDQYAKLFANGKDVVVIAISVDPDTALASWAHDEEFPMLFVSDSGGAIGRKYGVFNSKVGLDTRVVYVIAPDGKVAYRAMPFRELVASAYTELGEAVVKAGGS